MKRNSCIGRDSSTDSYITAAPQSGLTRDKRHILQRAQKVRPDHSTGYPLGFGLAGAGRERGEVGEGKMKNYVEGGEGKEDRERERIRRGEGVLRITPKGLLIPTPYVKGRVREN